MTAAPVWGCLVAATITATSTPVSAASPPPTETIVFIRHGEKPADGLGQLDCQGLNRSLSLPAVIQAKFGRPTALFAPDPAKLKDDEGKPYSYVRPLATIEPTAVRFGLPVDTRFGFAEVDGLRAALEASTLHDATVVVAWEHKQIDVVAEALMAAYGGPAGIVPKWHRSDFDGIYVVKISWRPEGPVAAFARDREGLDDRPTTCPN